MEPRVGMTGKGLLRPRPQSLLENYGQGSTPDHALNPYWGIMGRVPLLTTPPSPLTGEILGGALPGSFTLNPHEVVFVLFVETRFPETHSVDQASKICLPQPPECWN